MNYRKREEEIVKAHENGETYASIGKRYSISSSRVGQIIQRYHERKKVEESDPLFKACMANAGTVHHGIRTYHALIRSGYYYTLESVLNESDIENFWKIRQIGKDSFDVIMKIRKQSKGEE